MTHLPFVLWLIALSACGTAAPTRGSATHGQPTPPDHVSAPQRTDAPQSVVAASGAAHEVFSLDAVDEILRGGSLVVVDPGSQTLRALDVNSHQELWRVALGEPADRALIEDLGQGKLLVQVPGQSFHTIDLATGAHVAQRPSPPGWRFVQRAAGACALNGPCSIAPISCDDGAALGPELSGATITFTPRDPGEDSASTCTSPLEVLGRAGDLSLYVIHLAQKEHAEVLALDRSGAVRWRSEDVACEQCGPVGVGVAADGSVCWTTVALEGEGVVHVFGCADGHPLFTRRIALAPGYRHPPLFTGWVAAPAGLFLTADTEATLLAPDGRARWTRPTEPDLLVLPAGLRAPSYPLALDRYARVEHVNAANGRMTSHEAVNDRELRIDEEGALSIVPTGQSYDRAGAPVPALRVFTFTRARSGSQVSLDGNVVLALPGDAHVVGERTTETGTRIVVAQERPDQPDRIHVLHSNAPR